MQTTEKTTRAELFSQQSFLGPEIGPEAQTLLHNHFMDEYDLSSQSNSNSISVNPSSIVEDVRLRLVSGSEPTTISTFREQHAFSLYVRRKQILCVADVLIFFSQRSRSPEDDPTQEARRRRMALEASINPNELGQLVGTLAQESKASRKIERKNNRRSLLTRVITTEAVLSYCSLS